ncbi:MAG: type II toxin-antitoxin system MqsR family toxin [Spirochaetales bacterium]|nr:type II toxin-antitoxin system MqsR family toxin [Spirochaetales bacterium]
MTRIKKAVSLNHVFLVPRRENKDTMLELDLTLKDIFNCIQQLSIADYDKGPEDDHDGSDGFIWFFHHPVSMRRIYIKLKLYEKNESDFVKILSFHQ